MLLALIIFYRLYRYILSLSASTPALESRNMRLFAPPLFLFSFLVLSTNVRAFLLEVWKEDKNCTGKFDEILNLRSDGDCIWIEGGYSFKYSSPIGCTLAMWQDAECNNGKAVMARQNVCFVPDYKAFAAMCAV